VAIRLKSPAMLGFFLCWIYKVFLLYVMFAGSLPFASAKICEIDYRVHMFPFELQLEAGLLRCESIDELYKHASAEMNLGLAADEQVRYATFRSPKRQREYVASRYLSKHVLADFTGVSAQHWTIMRHENGAAIAQSTQSVVAESVFLSISHSAGYCVVAAANHAIGIDIQHIESLKRWSKIQSTVFSKIELSSIELLQVPEQAIAFTEIWALKEALGKLRGTGLRPKQDKEISFQSTLDNLPGTAITIRGDHFILAIVVHESTQLSSLNTGQGLLIKQWQLS
jgi:phosphopantetheinyl transferase